MLLSIYILLQLVVIGGLFFTFYSDTPISSAITMVFSGVLMIGSWVLNIGNEFIWDPSIRAYVQEPLIIHTPYLPAINMLVFALAIMYFFHDIFELIKGEAPKLNNIASKTEGMNKQRGDYF